MSLLALFGESSAAAPDRYDLTGSDTHNNNGGGLGGTYFNNGSYPGYRNVNGRTLVDRTALTNPIVIIVVGQSNGCAVSETPYTPTSSNVFNLNIYDGGVYRFTDPPLGCSQTSIASQGYSPPSGSWLGRLGQKLVDSGVTRPIVFVSASMAGSWIGDWDPLQMPNNYQRLKVALLRCSAIGWTPSATIWHQGEGDSGSNTPGVNYTACGQRIIDQSRADGYLGPWFICQVSWNGGLINNTIRAAQAALADHGARVWLGADTDTLDNSWRLDTGHFSNAGMDQVASLMLAKLQAYGAPFV
jgi:hypothetical protein